ncbi:MAG TPA: phosphopantetheine-binding protein [Candidatus Angelobacter sp.]|jgi:acyl carrier protein|nr:phosphopantetheine-binding protein [Candidatus Angelobacter sp.]
MQNSMNGSSGASAHAETERTLLQIWSEVLNTDQISIHEDFLSLGGDSLAAMRCINRIIAMFGVEVPLDLFLLESATIAQVASEIASIQPNAGQTVARGRA